MRTIMLGLCAAVVLFVVFVAVLGGCAGGWSEHDTTSLTDAVHLDMQVEQACTPPAADAGQCNAAQVRGLELANLCTLSSRLYAHRQPVPDAGVACRPAP
jgi:hypothetical protein